MSGRATNSTLDTSPSTSDGSPQRPVTSKARGICRYYHTRYGCYNGDRCKFLHGQSEQLTPYDKNKTCRFYASGWCLRGEKCWFRHEQPVSSEPPQSADPEEEENLCSICYDKPVTFGLLMGCSHVFCLACIKNWRGSDGKSVDMVEAGTTKTCPMCRTPSKFVTPSSMFFSQGDPGKIAAIENYKNSMVRVKCKYFEKSRPSKRYCPFGRDCFYKHENADGTPYVFEHGAEYYMERRGFRDNYRDFETTIIGPDGGVSIEVMLERIRHEFRNTQSTHDMQRAVLSSVAAILGRQLLSQHDPGEEDEEGLAGSSSGGAPHSIQPLDWQAGNVPFTPPSEDAESINILDPYLPYTQPSPSSPRSSVGATLDPSSPLVTPSYLDDMRPLHPGPSDTESEGRFDGITPLWDIEDLLRDHAERQRINEDSTALEAPSSTAQADTVLVESALPTNNDPPFMTDGRGRVVWSSTTSRTREGRRSRATSSSATIVPHVKPIRDLSRMEESSDESLQQESSGPPRRLVRRRSLPSVSLSADTMRPAEFMTDGRGRVVFASNHY